MTLFNRLISGEIETVAIPKEFGVDEMLSVGLLMVVENSIEVEFTDKRSCSEIKDNPKYILINVGAGDFDSNQTFYDVDECGNKLTAFSKLWKVLGEDIIGYKELSDVFYDMIIGDIDNIIAGRYKAETEFNITDILSYYLPEWNEKFKSENEAYLTFTQAARFASAALSRVINHYVQMDKALDIVYDKFDSNTDGILVFDEFLPVFGTIDQINIEQDNKVYFIVYPDKKDTTKYIFQSALVDGKKMIVDKNSAPTEKDALIDYLKSFLG